MSGLNKRYHARNVVRAGGRKLAGWSPGDIARLLKRREHAKMLEARYDTVRLDHARLIVFISDRNEGDRSVTNDAERVVRAVHIAHPGYRIIYRDTMGRWDELLHTGGVFKSFAPYHGEQP